jgi:hypothetical protein
LTVINEGRLELISFPSRKEQEIVVPLPVKVVNDVRNVGENRKRPGRISRKDAEHYIKRGRAEWVGQDQLRLILSHPDNVAAAARARAWEADYRPGADGDRTTEALRLFGVNPPVDNTGHFRRRGGGLAAVDRPRSHRQKPKAHVDHLIAPTIDAHQNQVHRLFMEGARESYRKADGMRNAQRLKE